MEAYQEAPNDHAHGPAMGAEMQQLVEEVFKTLRLSLDRIPFDVVGTIVTDLLLKLETLDAIDNPRAYCARAVRNRLMDHFRRQRRDRFVQLESALTQHEVPSVLPDDEPTPSPYQEALRRVNTREDRRLLRVAIVVVGRGGHLKAIAQTLRDAGTWIVRHRSGRRGYLEPTPYLVQRRLAELMTPAP